MRLEILDEARDFGESLGPHNITNAKIETYDERQVLKIVTNQGLTVILDDIKEWAEYLTDLL
jgi:hypothetical protein